MRLRVASCGAHVASRSNSKASFGNVGLLCSPGCGQSLPHTIRSGAAPLNYEIKSWRDLEGWFLAQIELQESFGMTRGCPFGTIGNEVTQNDELIRQDLNLIFEVVRNKLAAFFIHEKAKGRLSRNGNENELADFCIATIQGAMLMGKIKRNSRPAAASVREAMAHLKRYAVAPTRSAAAGRS